MTWKMKCPALGCNNDHRLHKALMWHRFPLRRPLLLAKWTVRLKPNINFEHRRLCAMHFHKDCYVKTNDEQKPLKLKRNAYPTMFEGGQIDEHFLLDESQANVEDKSVPPTTVRKRDVAEYKKKKEQQQRQQVGGADCNLDLDGNLTYHRNDDEEEDEDNLLLGDIKLGQSPLMQSADSPSQVLQQLHHKEPSTHALLSMARHSFEPSSSEQPGSESFFNAVNDQFNSSPQQEGQNNFPQQDVKDWAEQFMAGTLGTNGSSTKEQQTEQNKPSATGSTRTTRGSSGQQLTGAAKRKAAHVTRLGTTPSQTQSTRSASSDVPSQQKSSSSTTVAPPHMKKTNSISSNSGSSSPNSPLSGGGTVATGANAVSASNGGDAETSNARSFDIPATSSSSGMDKSAAQALANAFIQNPLLAASLGSQFLSAMVSANNNHSGNNSSVMANSSIAATVQHYAGRQNSISTAAEQSQKSAGKRKSTAANLQQMRPAKTIAVQSTQNEMMPPVYNTRAAGNNMQHVYNNSVPNGFNINRLMPNLHAITTSQFSNNYAAQHGTNSVDRREFERLVREVDSLRRELAAKDNELRELRNNAANGSSAKQPAFALIPLGTNNISLTSLARFLQTCGGGSAGMNGGNDTELDGGDDAGDNDNQFEIQEMQCPLVGVGSSGSNGNSTINGNCTSASNSAVASGYHRSVQNSNNFHHNMPHFMMPSMNGINTGNIEQHTLTAYEIKH